MIIVSVIAFIIFAVSLVWTFVIFDQLVKHLYLEHREIWNSIGKPSGFFWNPDGGFYTKGEWSRMKISFFLPFLFNKPDWTQTDQTSQELFNKLRPIGIFGILAWLAFFICLILSSRSS